VLAQVRRGPEPAGVGHVVDARAGRLQRGARGVDALRVQPLQRRQPGLGGEAARERALGDVGVRGQLAHGQRLAQAPQRPLARRRQRPVALRHRAVDVLRLAAVAMG
jgi:hypothetical protein